MTSKASYLAGYVEAVVEDFAAEIDPDEKVYPNYPSLGPLRADLEEVIDGRVADWIIEQRERAGKEQAV